MPFWANLGFEPNRKDYVRHAKCLAEAISEMQQWIWRTMGDHSDTWNLATFQSDNRTWSIWILRHLAEYVSLYTGSINERAFKFTLFVEGDSEFEALQALALQLNGHPGDRRWPQISPILYDVQNIQGSGNLRDLGLLLKDYQERRIAYFVLMDNHSDVPKNINKLVKKGLLNKSRANWAILGHSFEESFPTSMVAGAVAKIYPSLAVTSATIAGWKRAAKPIGRQLEALAANSAVTFSKKELATALGESLAEAYNARMGVCRRVEFLGVLKKIIKHCDALRRKYYLV
jgi:hypothetical protein